MTTGETIKKLRKKRGWNQTQLGEKVGLSFGGIASIEQDRADPSKATTLKLAEIFGVTTDYLLTGKESTGEISDEEREVLTAMREDNAFKEVAIEAAKLKKKVISYFKNYQQQVQQKKATA